MNNGPGMPSLSNGSYSATPGIGGGLPPSPIPSGSSVAIKNSQGQPTSIPASQYLSNPQAYTPLKDPQGNLQTGLGSLIQVRDQNNNLNHIWSSQLPQAQKQGYTPVSGKSANSSTPSGWLGGLLQQTANWAPTVLSTAGDIVGHVAGAGEGFVGGEAVDPLGGGIPGAVVGFFGPGTAQGSALSAGGDMLGKAYQRWIDGGVLHSKAYAPNTTAGSLLKAAGTGAVYGLIPGGEGDKAVVKGAEDVAAPLAERQGAQAVDQVTGHLLPTSGTATIDHIIPTTGNKIADSWLKKFAGRAAVGGGVGVGTAGIQDIGSGKSAPQIAMDMGSSGLVNAASMGLLSPVLDKALELGGNASRLVKNVIASPSKTPATEQMMSAIKPDVQAMYEKNLMNPFLNVNDMTANKAKVAMGGDVHDFLTNNGYLQHGAENYNRQNLQGLAGSNGTLAPALDKLEQAKNIIQQGINGPTDKILTDAQAILDKQPDQNAGVQKVGEILNSGKTGRNSSIVDSNGHPLQTTVMDNQPISKIQDVIDSIDQLPESVRSSLPVELVRSHLSSDLKNTINQNSSGLNPEALALFNQVNPNGAANMAANESPILTNGDLLENINSHRHILGQIRQNLTGGEGASSKANALLNGTTLPADLSAGHKASNVAYQHINDSIINNIKKKERIDAQAGMLQHLQQIGYGVAAAKDLAGNGGGVGTPYLIGRISELQNRIQNNVNNNPKLQASMIDELMHTHKYDPVVMNNLNDLRKALLSKKTVGSPWEKLIAGQVASRITNQKNIPNPKGPGFANTTPGDAALPNLLKSMGINIGAF